MFDFESIKLSLEGLEPMPIMNQKVDTDLINDYFVYQIKTCKWLKLNT